MRMHKMVKRSYDQELDTFRHYFLIAGCFLLALLVNEKFTFQEERQTFRHSRLVLWAFSIYSEAVSFATRKWKCGQFERAICVPSLGLSCIVHSQLDLPLLHRTTFQSMDSLRCRSVSDSFICRFFLLLLSQLEKQCKASAASVSQGSVFLFLHLTFLHRLINLHAG